MKTQVPTPQTPEIRVFLPPFSHSTQNLKHLLKQILQDTVYTVAKDQLFLDEAHTEANFTWETSGIEFLHKLGFKTAAMALCDDSVSISDPQLAKEEKLAIILGTEGDGLANCTIADCDYTVKIPMSHGVDSLNVAAASAVAFWELGKCVI